VPVLGQHPGRQREYLPESCRPGLNLAHQHLRHGLGVTVIHLLIMPPARPGRGT
jgi:hypothetical protein